MPLPRILSTKYRGAPSKVQIAYAIAWAKRQIARLEKTIQEKANALATAGVLTPKGVRQFHYKHLWRNTDITLKRDSLARWTVDLDFVFTEGIEPVLWDASGFTIGSATVRGQQAVGRSPGDNFGTVENGSVQIRTVESGANVTAVNLPALGNFFTYQTIPLAPTPDIGGLRFERLERVQPRLWTRTIFNRADEVEQTVIANSVAFTPSAILETPSVYANLGVNTSHIAVFLSSMYWDQANDLITFVANLTFPENIGAIGRFSPSYYSNTGSQIPGDSHAVSFPQAGAMMFVTLPRTKVVEALSTKYDGSAHRGDPDDHSTLGANAAPLLRRNIVETRTNVAAGTPILLEWGGFTDLEFLTVPAADGAFLVQVRSLSLPATTDGIINTRGNLEITFSGFIRGTVIDGVASTVDIAATTAIKPVAAVTQPLFAVGAMDFTIDFPDPLVQPIWFDPRSALSSPGGTPDTDLKPEYIGPGASDDVSQWARKRTNIFVRFQTAILPQGFYSETARAAQHPQGYNLGVGSGSPPDSRLDTKNTGAGGLPFLDASMQLAYKNPVEPALFEYIIREVHFGSITTDINQFDPDPDPSELQATIHGYSETNVTLRQQLRLSFVNGVMSTTVQPVFHYQSSVTISEASPGASDGDPNAAPLRAADTGRYEFTGVGFGGFGHTHPKKKSVIPLGVTTFNNITDFLDYTPSTLDDDFPPNRSGLAATNFARKIFTVQGEQVENVDEGLENIGTSDDVDDVAVYQTFLNNGEVFSFGPDPTLEDLGRGGTNFRDQPHPTTIEDVGLFDVGLRSQYVLYDRFFVQINTRREFDIVDQETAFLPNWGVPNVFVGTQSVNEIERDSQYREDDYLLFEWLPKAQFNGDDPGIGGIVTVFWPNAIPFDPDNPGQDRDGKLMFAHTLEHTAALTALLAKVNGGGSGASANPGSQGTTPGTTEEVNILRAAVLAEITVIVNNFASDEFMVGLTGARAYVIFQPTS